MVIGPGFTPAMPEDSFAKILNDYLNSTALADVRDVMPRAHAVARCQINIRALHMIKTQFKNNAWIVPIGRDDRQRVLWELSAAGERHLSRLMQQQMNGRA